MPDATSHHDGHVEAHIRDISRRSNLTHATKFIHQNWQQQNGYMPFNTSGNRPSVFHLPMTVRMACVLPSSSATWSAKQTAHGEPSGLRSTFQIERVPDAWWCWRISSTTLGLRKPMGLEEDVAHRNMGRSGSSSSGGMEPSLHAARWITAGSSNGPEGRARLIAECTSGSTLWWWRMLLAVFTSGKRRAGPLTRPRFDVLQTWRDGLEVRVQVPT